MTDEVREKCELLVGNHNAIRKGFFLENELMSSIAGLIFASAGKEADVEKLKACRKILKIKTRLLSNLRAEAELVVLSKMALSDSPEQYLDDYLSVYDKVTKGKLLENDYMAIAATLILDFGLQDESDEIIAKANEIMQRMDKDHPILTSSEDTSFAIFLAITRKSADAILTDLKGGYTYLRETCKVKISADPVYELCEVLAVSYGDMEDKCDKVMRLYGALKERKADFASNNGLSSLGALAALDISPEQLVDEIIDAEAFLKSQKGFNNKEIDASRRLIYSTLVVAAVYGKQLEAAGNSVIVNTLSVIRAKQIAKMISVICSVAPNVITAVLPEDSTAENSK